MDLFGAPIILTYRGESKFRTACGGCVSIILTFVFLAIFAVELYLPLVSPDFLSGPKITKNNPTFSFSPEQSMLAGRLYLTGTKKDIEPGNAHYRITYSFNSSDSETITDIPAILCTDLYKE